MPRYPFLLSLKLIRFISNSNPNFPNFTRRFLSIQSSWIIHAKFPIPKTYFNYPFSTLINANPNPNPNFQERDFDTLCSLLKNPNFENALNGIQIKPTESLLLAIIKRIDLLPNQIFSLFKWAEKQPGYHSSGLIFNLVLKFLAKSGEFKWVLMILLDKVKRGDGSELVSAESFGILIKYCACSGMTLPAIHTFKFASILEIDVFDVLLAALCKYGHVKVASDCVNRKMYLDPNWVPSIDVYNTLLEGWFRVRNLEQVERLWLWMRREKLVLDVVSYSILVEGYCRKGLIDKAVELLSDMRMCGVGPTRKIYGLIVDALAGEGRFKEALGMLERFLVLESGPTLLTYNSLVKGFCKAGDLVGAGKILKMMTSRGVMPTARSYNYFFRYFAKHGKVEEGVNLYRNMIEKGYDPDLQTYHLLLKMLCEQETLELAIQIRKDMKLRGHVLDLDTSTMLINLLCRMRKLKEAVDEFEEMIQGGVVPKELTYQTLHFELKKKGLHELARKLCQLVATVPSSTTLPKTFEGLVDISRQRRKSIMQRAKQMSDILKTCSEPRHRQLAKHGRLHEITSASKKAVDKG